LPVCAHRWTAVVPAGDAQAVAGSAVAGAPAGSRWYLAAGADPGDSCGRRPRGVRARAVAALSTYADPGQAGSALPGRTLPGAGSRRAGNVGERAAAVATGRDEGAGRRGGP